MKNKFLTLMTVVVLALLSFNSCQERVNGTKPTKSEISFIIDNPNTQAQMLKGSSTDIPVCSDAVPDHVYLVIEDATGQQTEYNLDILEQLEDGRLTAMLKLDAGQYKLIKFEVKADDNTTVWASPVEGSYYDNLYHFDNNVTLTFTIEPFKKISTEVDVLCWQDYDYTNFGYTNFDYHEYEIKTVCFFGDVCTKFYKQWHSEFYDNNPYVGQEYQTYDFNAIFGVKIFSNSSPYIAINDTLVNTNVEWQGLGQPLCIEYLDDKLIDGETFYAHIYLYTPDGNEVEVGVVEFTDEQWSGHNWGGEDGIFDFIVGGTGCLYNDDADANYQLQWLPLPSEVEFTLGQSSNSYFSATFTSITGLSTAEFTVGNEVEAWCGNDTISIVQGHNYIANIYSIYNIPSGSFYSGIDQSKAVALNWIANEVIGTGAYGMSTIQKAIWYILGYADGVNNTVAQDALAITSYNPPIGGYVFVLVDPYYDNTTQENSTIGHFQLLLIRYDP